MNRSILQRIYLRALRQLGLKKLSWDKQFEAGVSCYGPRSANTINRVQDLCRGGRLLEFGCGEGDLPFILPPGTYSSYVGYDISEVAIERARERTVTAGLNSIDFKQCDIARWDGIDSASLILAEECLYYLSAANIEKFLLRCTRCLTRDGSILVIVHSASKHARTLDVCRRVCCVRDEVVIEGRVFLTLNSKLQENAVRAEVAPSN
jgi:cyclopropane fatty-acyl-phospholipid synthase-like methyltransferase